jgi:hypothetical protein
MLDNIPVHNYSCYANKTLQWVGTDLHSRLIEIQSDSELHQKWADSGWSTDTVIEYKFNEHGFRTDQFDQSLRVGVFGSSPTVGVGLHYYQTWVHHFSNMLNVPVWNLSTGTGSFDTFYRMIKYYINYLNIGAVILATCELDKFEIWNGDRSVITINGRTHASPKIQNISDLWYSHDNNKLINGEKNLEAIRYICGQFDIPIIIFNLADANKYTPVEPVDWSRCVCHVGPKYHKAVANFVVDRYWSTVNTPWH